VSIANSYYNTISKEQYRKVVAYVFSRKLSRSKEIMNSNNFELIEEKHFYNAGAFFYKNLNYRPEL
jgi:hypothetical protein